MDFIDGLRSSALMLGQHLRSIFAPGPQRFEYTLQQPQEQDTLGGLRATPVSNPDPSRGNWGDMSGVRG